MGRFVVGRLLILIPVMFVISLAVFVLLHYAPGDPVTLAAGAYNMTPEVEASVRRDLGLLDPLHVQFGRWLGRALTGDLGRSFFGARSVSAVFGSRFAATFELTTVAMIIAVAIGIPVGIFSAYKRNSVFDYAGTLTALVGVSMPSFWFGLIAIYIFAVKFDWFAVSGRIGTNVDLRLITNLYIVDSLLTWNLAALGSTLRHLILPAFVLGLVQTAFIARMVRATMLEVLQGDYIRTARAKGLDEKLVLVRHAFRNAAIPVLTVVGLQVGFLMGGTVIVETVFSWPGVGKLLVDSVLSRDYPMVQGITVATGALFATVNLATDVLYRFLNPEVRLS